jgi:hypothetical protein
VDNEEDIHWHPFNTGGVIPVNPDDPPRFESQASYLRRFGLLLPGEERRLGPSDFEPEVITLKEPQR